MNDISTHQEAQEARMAETLRKRAGDYAPPRALLSRILTAIAEEPVTLSMPQRSSLWGAVVGQFRSSPPVFRWAGAVLAVVILMVLVSSGREGARIAEQTIQTAGETSAEAQLAETEAPVQGDDPNRQSAQVSTVASLAEVESITDEILDSEAGEEYFSDEALDRSDLDAFVADDNELTFEYADLL